MEPFAVQPSSRITQSRLSIQTILIVMFCILFSSIASAQNFYVANSGNNDTGNGTQLLPWATINHAIDNVADGAMINVAGGTYNGRVRLDQQFDSGIIIRSSTPYAARLRYDQGAVVICFTCRGIVFEGFDIAHSLTNTGGLVIQIQDLLGSVNGSNNGSDPVVSNVTLRNNIIHDSTNNDLLKINNGAEQILIEGNMFYNQAGSDEHIDINSTSDVTVQDNIFFNTNTQTATSSFVVVKDSNSGDDSILGARDTIIKRNIFFNWQGSDGQGFLRIGEDSTSNFEADGVLLENNLLLGNSSTLMRSAFTVQGSRNVRFRYNTVTGNLPTRSYAARLIALGDNQPNEQVTLEYNIWSDTTGTMGTEGFNGVDVFEASAADNAGSVSLNRNLYYNGGSDIPADTSQGINISDDANAILGNPALPLLQGVSLPTWTGSQFNGGFSSIRSVFQHYARTYGTPGISGAGRNLGSGSSAPLDDLLGTPRGSAPDIGAVEIIETGPPAEDNATVCFPLQTSKQPATYGIVCF